MIVPQVLYIYDGRYNTHTPSEGDVMKDILIFVVDCLIFSLELPQ